MTRAVGSFFRAFRLLATNRSVRRLAVAPLVVNVVVFLVGVPLAIWGATWWVGGFFDGSGWAAVLSYLLKLLVAVGVIFSSLFLFTLVGAVIAGPFAGPLAARVEEIEMKKRGVPPSAITERGVLSDVGRSLLYALGRLAIFLLLYPPIFLLQFIPGAGIPIHAVLAVLYAAFVLSVDFSDPALDRRLDSFRDKIRYVWKRKGTYLGFGLCCVGMMLIPLVNLLMIPVCITAATMLVVDEIADSRGG